MNVKDDFRNGFRVHLGMKVLRYGGIRKKASLLIGSETVEGLYVVMVQSWKHGVPRLVGSLGEFVAIYCLCIFMMSTFRLMICEIMTNYTILLPAWIYEHFSCEIFNRGKMSGYMEDVPGAAHWKCIRTSCKLGEGFNWMTWMLTLSSRCPIMFI